VRGPALGLALPALVLAMTACGGGSDSGSNSTPPTTKSAATTTGTGAKTTSPKPAAKKAAGGPYAPPKGAVPDPYRSRQYAIDDLNLPAAWKTSAGQGVTIAIVDSGVDLSHPDLKGRLVPGHDFVGNDSTPKDENGHGTHVAGIAAAATDNGVGISGGAPDAKLMPVRVLDSKGSGSQTNIGKGIAWAADHGARVINLSLGESGLAGQLLRGGQLNSDIEHAVRKGAVVVAAAGNDGTASKPYRATTPVLIVGAVDENGQPARFSNFGASDAVTAPGVQIYSTLPNYSTEQSDQHGQGYGYLDGTSMAAPYVSAVAALLVAQGRTPQQVIDAIQATARNPQHVAKLGLGIVDAHAAVTSAHDVKPKTTSPSTTPKTGTTTKPAATPRRKKRRG
jgi:type VII secretion-associated serine protease mycosin